MADIGVPKIAVKCFYLQLLPSLAIAFLASFISILPGGLAFLVDIFLDPSRLALPYYLFAAAFVMHVVTGVAIRCRQPWGRDYALWARRVIILLFIIWLGLILIVRMYDPLFTILIIGFGPIIGTYILLSWPALILLMHPAMQAYLDRSK